MRGCARYRHQRRGSTLVEFAIVALVMYLLLAAMIEFGRIFYSAQAVQQTADVAARELARCTLPPDITFATALKDPDVVRRVYSSDWLVIELDRVPDGDLDALFAQAPLVNQLLRPLMIVDQPDTGPRMLRYPGRLKSITDTNSPYSNETTNPNHLTVDVPIIVGNDESQITFLDVVEEVKPGGQSTGPFSFVADVPNGQEWQRGLVALRINYPYQAATMTAYQSNPDDPLAPNIGNPIVVPPGDQGPAGTNAGVNGLGRQYAFARQVRPYRKVLSGQAIARREILQ